MTKSARKKTKLVSSVGIGRFYTTMKSERTRPEKMELKKYNLVARQHVTYKEVKIK